MALIPHDWKDGTIQRQNQPGLIRDNDVEEYVARIVSSNHDHCPSLALSSDTTILYIYLIVLISRSIRLIYIFNL